MTQDIITSISLAIMMGMCYLILVELTNEEDTDA